MALDDMDQGDFDDDDGNDDTYLTFSVAGEEYAVHVGHVTEIVRLQRSFAVPDVPDYIRGVINLRGKVIPLLDVRRRFGLSAADYTDRTVVVVLEVGEIATGLVVDGVSDVTEIAPGQIETRVQSANAGTSLLKGMGRRGDRVSFILDVPVLVAAEAGATAVPAQPAS